MNKSFAQQKIYWLSAIFVALIIAIILLVVFPLIRQIKISSQDLAQSEKTLDVFFQSWQSLEKSKNQTDLIEQRLKENPPLLARPDALKFIMALEEIAKTTNQRCQITSVNKPAAKTAPDETTLLAPENESLNFQISLKGTLPNLMKFLVQLENLSYANQVQSLQISRLNQTDITVGKDTNGLSAGDIETTINISVPVE